MNRHSRVIPMLKKCVILFQLFILSACITTESSTRNTMTKDEYFAEQCFQTVKKREYEDVFNQSQFRNCKVKTYSFWKIKPRQSEYSQRPEICDKDDFFLTSEERLTKELLCNGARFGEPYYATWRNEVRIDCTQPWGETVKRKYRCYMTDNGHVEHYEFLN